VLWCTEAVKAAVTVQTDRDLQQRVPSLICRDGREGYVNTYVLFQLDEVSKL
jgi:hypothetical protein